MVLLSQGKGEDRHHLPKSSPLAHPVPSPMLSWQWREILGELGELQAHGSDPTCPCVLADSGEYCLPKHALRLNVLARETSPMAGPGHASMLETLAGEALDYHTKLKDRINCGKAHKDEGDVVKWAREWRKKVEAIYYACRIAQRRGHRVTLHQEVVPSEVELAGRGFRLAPETVTEMSRTANRTKKKELGFPLCSGAKGEIIPGEKCTGTTCHIKIGGCESGSKIGSFHTHPGTPMQQRSLSTGDLLTAGTLRHLECVGAPDVPNITCAFVKQPGPLPSVQRRSYAYLHPENTLSVNEWMRGGKGKIFFPEVGKLFDYAEFPKEKETDDSRTKTAQAPQNPQAEVGLSRSAKPLCTPEQKAKLERCIRGLKVHNKEVGCSPAEKGSKKCPVPQAVCQSSIGCRPGRASELRRALPIPVSSAAVSNLALMQALNPKAWQRIQKGGEATLDELVVDPKLRQILRIDVEKAVANTPVRWKGNLPFDVGAQYRLRGGTPELSLALARRKAGTPSGIIEVGPQTAPENLLHEAAHAVRASLGRVFEVEGKWEKLAQELGPHRFRQFLAEFKPSARQGKPVPPEVLADYPDLTQPAPGPKLVPVLMRRSS